MFDLLRGLTLTLKHVFRKPVTIQYPEEQKPYADRYHGRHQLNRYDDGLEKCIGCELCAWACPADAIYVQGANNTPEERFSPGERFAIDYQINYLRCIFCGLCIEACPTRALTMGGEDAVAGISREAMIFTKDMLLGPVPSGGADTPHTDADVQARGLPYYGGFAATTSLASVQRATELGPHGSGTATLGIQPDETAKPPGDPTTRDTTSAATDDAAHPRETPGDPAVLEEPEAPKDESIGAPPTHTTGAVD